MTTNQQLELGFNGLQYRGQAGAIADRQARAAWWFNQMRRVVANAVDRRQRTTENPGWHPQATEPRSQRASQSPGSSRVTRAHEFAN
jgi:hypothetical protein